LITSVYASVYAARPSRLTDMIAKVDSVFFDPDYAALRMKTLTALIAGQPPGTNTDEWSVVSTTRQAPIQDTATIALDVAKDHAAELHSRAMWSLIIQICLMLCAISVVTSMMWVVSFRVSNPLHQRSAAMRKLAGGDFDVVLPGLERKGEIGAMATAVKEFKVAPTRIFQNANIIGAHPELRGRDPAN
jgi:HAMP domain-containing protein